MAKSCGINPGLKLLMDRIFQAGEEDDLLLQKLARLLFLDLEAGVMWQLANSFVEQLKVCKEAAGHWSSSKKVSGVLA